MPDLTAWSGRISWQDLLFLVGVLLAVVVAMRVTRRGGRRTADYERVYSREEILAPATTFRRPTLNDAGRSTPIAGASLGAELDAEFLGRLEDRIQALQELLLSADRKILELNALVRHEAMTIPVADLTRSEPRALADLRAQTQAHHQAEALARARDLTHSLPGIAASSIEKSKRYKSIYVLIDQGRTAAEVARALEMPIGEVELIVGLRGGT